jgi:hypothetical protein
MFDEDFLQELDLRQADDKRPSTWMKMAIDKAIVKSIMSNSKKFQVVSLTIRSG